MFANRLLPILASLILLLALMVGFKSCQKAPETLTLAKVPVPPQPDADSPADTVRTLTAQVAELKAQSASIERQNTELLRQRDALESRTRNMILDELHKQPPVPSNPEVGELTQQMAALKQRVNEFSLNSSLPLPGGVGAPIPATQDMQVSYGGSPDTLQWIEPLGFDRLHPAAGLASGGLPGGVLGAGSSSGSVLHPEGSALPVPPPPPPGSELRPAALDGVAQPAGHTTPESLREPAYTVPRNATLVGSTAMTALIGKVPIKDMIADPFPFKVIVGRDNLASNGLDIPGVDGMVFSGHAVGDWTLGCVRGNVESVTFTFEDGTIRTLTGNANAANNAATSNSSGINNMLGTGSFGGNLMQQVMPIGWLSDRRGIPCVSGERISNAAAYLSGRVLARAAEAAAKAFGQRNVTNSVTPLGGVFSAITGDAAQYARLNALAGASDELSQYIKERAAQNFDVVYVDTGAEIAIHIDRELPIDYDPTGRKTHYEPTLSRVEQVLD